MYTYNIVFAVRDPQNPGFFLTNDLKTADLPRIGESISFAGDHALLRVLPMNGETFARAAVVTTVQHFVLPGRGPAVPSVYAEIAPGTQPRPLARAALESLPGWQYDALPAPDARLR